jgi:transcriptional regulator with XRE-family HTH domain
VDVESVDDLRALVGSRLRAIRESRKMSLRTLAKNLDLTPGFVSQIENGRVMPSIANLVRFCAALGIEVGDVFSGTAPNGRVVREAERKTYVWETGIRDEVLSVDSTKRLELLHSTFAPGGTTGEPFTHGSEIEVALVLRGRIRVTVGDAHYELQPGDALTFSGTLPHSIANIGADEAEVIWALTPATF